VAASAESKSDQVSPLRRHVNIIALLRSYCIILLGPGELGANSHRNTAAIHYEQWLSGAI
jgi:hypothetical protein